MAALRKGRGYISQITWALKEERISSKGRRLYRKGERGQNSDFPNEGEQITPTTRGMWCPQKETRFSSMKGIEITHSEKAEEEEVCWLCNREKGIVYEGRSHWTVRPGEKKQEARPSSGPSQPYTDGHRCSHPGCWPRSAEWKGTICLAAARFLERFQSKSQ